MAPVARIVVAIIALLETFSGRRVQREGIKEVITALRERAVDVALRGVHPALIALLERIRAEVGGPVTINSGYRTPAHNAHVGGASSSRHKYGQAADIHVRGMTNAQVYAVAKALNPGGLGKYHSFTHVDIEGVNRRWDGP